MIMNEKKSVTVERTTISIDEKISKKAKEYAKANNLKFSNYIQKLILYDLSNEAASAPADAIASDVISRLVTDLCGKLTVAEFGHLYKDLNQPLYLKEILENWLIELRKSDKKITPNARRLYDEIKIDTAARRATSDQVNESA